MFSIRGAVGTDGSGYSGRPDRGLGSGGTLAAFEIALLDGSGCFVISTSDRGLDSVGTLAAFETSRADGTGVVLVSEITKGGSSGDVGETCKAASGSTLPDPGEEASGDVGELLFSGAVTSDVVVVG